MATIAQRNFSSGEPTPALHARVDLTKYHSGLKTCRNMTILRHGGVTNRPGTKFIAKSKIDGRNIRLIEFIFSREDTYCLEFGHEYVRFFKDGRQIMSGNSPLEVVTPYTEEMLPTIQYAQSGDVLILCHPSVHPKELQRRSDGWHLVDSRINPSIAGAINVYGTAIVPTNTSTEANPMNEQVRALPLGFEPNPPAGFYAVTAISEETGEESLVGSFAPDTSEYRGPSNRFLDGHNLDVSPITVRWDAVPGASEYNVYKTVNGIYQLLGITKNRTLKDFGQPTDATVNPPEDREIFNNNEYPSTVTFHQQRLFYGNTSRRPGRILASKIGKHRDFTTRRNIQPDDSLDFEIAGRQVSRVNSLLGLDELVVLTDSGEFTIRGEGGAITPTTLNARPETYFGASNLIRPVVIGRSAIFAQRGDSIVRDFKYDFSSGGYEGNDLTIFSSHLFDGHQLVDIGYVKAPNNNIWIARADNQFLVLTYIKEQELVGWARCDFENGQLVSMAGLPEENDIDRLYMAVKRGDEIHIERMADRYRDEIFLDSARVFAGRNSDRSALNILTAFVRGSVVLSIQKPNFNPIEMTPSNEFHVTLPDGSEIIFENVRLHSTGDISSAFITETVRGMTHQEVVNLLHANGVGVNFDLYDWSFKTNIVPDVSHLGTQNLGVYADGFVFHSPNNPSYPVRQASSTNPLDRFYSYIVAGLPITSDVETLSIDSADAPKLRTRKKLINNVRLDVLETRGLFVGRAAPEGNGIEELNEFKIRQYEDYDKPVRSVSGQIEVNISADWDSNGSVFIRQVDPLPFTITAITPSGYIPAGG